MTQRRKRHSAKFKFDVALEAAKGVETVNQIAGRYEVHFRIQVSQWKRQLLDEGIGVFSSARERTQREQDALQTDLFEQIGRLKMELEWLKKKLPTSTDDKRALIEPNHPVISLARQCELVELSRSAWYYTPATETAAHLQLMRQIDELYLAMPYLGSRRIAVKLSQTGQAVNRKRVQRLLRIMGLEAIYPKPRTSQAAPEHKIYPYRLRNVAVTVPNQVWCADITYIPMPTGFMYLVAIMDWYSRYVLGWRLSNTLDGQFCLDTLQELLARNKPTMFNTDQGVQFTARQFTATLENAGVIISMDGRGRMFDNIFIERLWRSLKWEDIYIKEYATVRALEAVGAGKLWTTPNRRVDHTSPAPTATATHRLTGWAKSIARMDGLV
ncbi:MAG: IS3 family transposase [Anaerolineales bacterium]|nr:IS3 family transposase [Anaerolineales bacterium]